MCTITQFYILTLYNNNKYIYRIIEECGLDIERKRMEKIKRRGRSKCFTGRYPYSIRKRNHIFQRHRSKS